METAQRSKTGSIKLRACNELLTPRAHANRHLCILSKSCEQFLLRHTNELSIVSIQHLSKQRNETHLVCSRPFVSQARKRLLEQGALENHTVHHTVTTARGRKKQKKGADSKRESSEKNSCCCCWRCAAVFSFSFQFPHRVVCVCVCESREREREGGVCE